MLIKLIVVNSNHFIRYKCKTTSRLSNITRLSNIIWIYITIDDNEKLSINEVLEVLIGVGTFSSTTSFDTQCLLFVTMNELKKFMPGGLQFFLFHLVVSYSVCFLLEFEATSHNAMFVGRVVVFDFISILNIVFSSAFEHRTDWCLASCFIFA